jgi:hypothetical protein
VLGVLSLALTLDSDFGGESRDQLITGVWILTGILALWWVLAWHPIANWIMRLPGPRRFRQSDLKVTLVQPKPPPSGAEVLARLEGNRAAQPTPPTPASSKPQKAGLRDVLQEDLRQGESLRQRLPNPFAGALTSYMFGYNTTEQDIDWWEDRIQDLLRPYPLKRARFMSDPHEPPITARSSILDDPTRRRLEHRLLMLAQIIQELPD